MSLTVSHCCWLSIIVFSNSMELLAFSHSLPLFLSVSLAACHSLSPNVAGFLSLSLLVPWICFMSLTVSYCCCLFLTDSPVLWSCCMSLSLSYSCWLSLAISLSSMELLDISHSLPLQLALSKSPYQFHGVAVFFLLSPIVAGCLSLSLLSL